MPRGFRDEDQDRSLSAPLTDVAGRLVDESERSFQVDCGDQIVWLPKSQTDHDGRGVFTLPEWLAKKKGLI